MISPHPPLRLVEGTGRSPAPVAAPRPLAAALELAALGAGLTLVATLLGRIPDAFHRLGAVQGLVTLGFGFYALALLRARRYAALPGAWSVVLGVALAARVALLPMAPALSDDAYRYLWEGRVLAHGGDPYRQPPDDPALAALRDRGGWERVNHRELAAIYPPLGLAGFALVAGVRPTIGALKLWVVLHDLALIAVLLAWARRLGLPAIAVAAYAWNPLLLLEYAGSGHNEPTALLWLALAGLLCDTRPSLSAAALAIGALVKLAPLAALPFLLPRWTWRARLVAAAILVPGLALYALETHGVHSGLAAYWSRWRNNELAFHYLEGLAGFAGARTLALVATAAVAAVLVAHRAALARGVATTLRAGLLLGPVLHPWYLGWALVLDPLAPSPPWRLLSWTALLNYGLLSSPAEGRSFHPPLAWRWVEYGTPLVLALGLFWWRRRAHAPGLALPAHEERTP